MPANAPPAPDSARELPPSQTVPLASPDSDLIVAVEFAFEMSNTPPDETLTRLDAEMLPGPTSAR